MALIETIILYCQLTLGIANPTTADIQSAELQMNSGATTTSITSSPTTCSNSTTGWDIYEGN